MLNLFLECKDTFFLFDCLLFLGFLFILLFPLSKRKQIMSCKFHKAIFHAVLAAALYAVSIPFSKLLLVEVPPTMLAAFLYIGAGIGMAMLGAVKKNRAAFTQSLR